MNPIARFRKKLCQRAIHNRLFDTLANLKKSIRSNLCYFQSVRAKVKSMLEPRKKVRPK